MTMRTRLTLTQKIAQGLYLSQSVYPRRNLFGKPSGIGLAVAFFLGAFLFVLICLAIIALAG